MNVPTTDADPRFADRARQPGLDLLRAIAIVIVVFYHAGIFGFSLPYRIQRFGWVGVDLFFVLSGYLIGGQLLKECAQQCAPRLGRFFWRRALRILPAYSVVLAVYVFLPSLREYPGMPPAWKFLAFTQNIGLQGGTAFSHAWSLCVEAQFYLALPFLLLLLARGGRRVIAAAIALFVAGIVVRAAIAYGTLQAGHVPFRAFQRLVYYPTWGRLDPLLLGVCVAAIEQHRPIWWARLSAAATWLWIVAVALVASALYLGETDQLTIAICAFQFPLVALGMAALLVCALSPRLPLERKAVPGAAFIASVAYSVYLTHKLAIHWAQTTCAAHGMDATTGVPFAFVLAVIAATGTALFFAIERPFLRFRQRGTAGPCLSTGKPAWKVI